VSGEGVVASLPLPTAYAITLRHLIIAIPVDKSKHQHRIASDSPNPRALTRDTQGWAGQQTNTNTTNAGTITSSRAQGRRARRSGPLGRSSSRRAFVHLVCKQIG